MPDQYSDWEAISDEQLTELMRLRVIDSIEGGEKYDDEIIFNLNDGTSIRMYHEQDCCESVTIEDICGDVKSAVGALIVHAEAVSTRVDSQKDFEEAVAEKPHWIGDLQAPEYYDSETWTFYRILTTKEELVIRWCGSSNGYYSESVDLQRRRKI